MTFDNGVTRGLGNRFDVEDGEEQKHGFKSM